MASPHGGINPHAQKSFSNSQAYDQHRPTYPPSVVQLLLDQLRVAGKQHARIVDLAAGSGKFTEALAARDEQFDVVAIEPHERMREVLLSKHLNGVTVSAGTADSMSLADESVDAVIVAQAFHWFANLTALKEIHRVLKPHGVLGLVWNIDDYNAPLSYEPKTSWEAKTQKLLFEVENLTGDHEPRFRHDQWQAVFDDQLKKTPLSLLRANDQYFSLPLGHHAQPFAISLPAEHVWERVNTIGHIAALEGEHKRRTRETFMEAISAPDTPRSEQGDVIVSGNTFAWWSSKIPTEGRESLTEVERPGE